jgi:ribosomal protein S18 acetylase RimI-like enzyme
MGVAISERAPAQRVRPLTDGDLERVIAIDRAHSGHSRSSFFEKRLAAAKASPNDFVHIGVVRGKSIVGFVLARILRGEFGRADAVAVLDALGVDSRSRARGVGQALMGELIRTLREKNVVSLHSQVEWSNHDLLRFFAGSGFTLAPRLALDRPVAEPLAEQLEEV